MTLLRTLRAAIDKWRVCLTDADERPDLNGCDGLTNYSTSEVLLNRNLEPHRLKTTYLHELGHVAADVINLQQLIIATTKLSKKHSAAIEECLIHAFIPQYVRLLQDAGMLKEGYAMLKPHREKKQ